MMRNQIIEDSTERAARPYDRVRNRNHQDTHKNTDYFSAHVHSIPDSLIMKASYINIRSMPLKIKRVLRVISSPPENILDRSIFNTSTGEKKVIFRIPLGALLPEVHIPSPGIFYIFISTKRRRIREFILF